MTKRVTDVSSESVIHCIQDVHVKELVKRLNWSVKIRWYYISISSLLILFVYLILDDHAINLHYEILVLANVFLFFCNLIYQYQLRYSYEKCLGTYELRYYLLLQIITDYLALMIVVYALGSIETPIILMIIPNAILATLFFTPRQSLLLTLFGMCLVITPLMLEYVHVIQVISIFDPAGATSFKASVLSQPFILFGYIFILFACVIFCWYLLCSITTRLIHNELELEQSYQDMLRLDKEKTHATLRSTHELKAPLAAIKNYVYTMKAGYAGEINDKVAKIIDRIGKRCDFLLNNVTDIIKLGNLKSYVVLDTKGDTEGNTQFHPIYLLKFLENFLSQNKALAHEKHITINMINRLTHTAEDADKCIMANKENLQLIFSNLLTNAINYSHENGIIDVVISEVLYEEQEPSADIGQPSADIGQPSADIGQPSANGQELSGYKKRLCVRIEDHGIGINERLIQKVFEEHFRANNAVSFYEGGTGLGLSIVKVCSQILGAELKIKSTLNQGTTVLIYFKTEGNIS